MSHNFILTNLDTDSISFCMPDSREVSKEEFKVYIDEINSFLPPLIEMADDGRYEAFVVVAAKNYIMKKGDKVKFKGSSLTAGGKEKALLELIEKIGLSLLNGINYPEIEKIYLSYVKEAQNVTDITRWAVKKTVTKPVLESENDPEARTNELKVLRAIKHLNPQEGDKVYVYDALDGMIQATEKGELKFLKDGSPKMIPNRILKTIDQYSNDYIPAKLIKRVFDTISIFDTIFTPMVEIHVPKKDLKKFNASYDSIPARKIEFAYKLVEPLSKGTKLTLDLLEDFNVSFVEYIKQFPEVKIREVSRFKGLVGEIEDD